MSLFDFLRLGPVRVAWDYRSSGVVWRLIPHKGLYLIGESRDLNSKVVSFFCLDFRNGTPLWQGRRLDEQWWVGLETVHEDAVIIHGYASPDMPEHRKIVLLDVRSGEVRWQNDELAFVSASGNVIYARKEMFDPQSILALDVHTGKIAGSGRQDGEPAGPAGPNEAEREAALPRPMANPVDPECGRALDRLGVDLRRISGVEHLETEGVTITSWYEARGDEVPQASWRQHVVVAQRATGRTLFRDTIAEETTFPVPGAFFVMGETLCYVKERSVVRALSIRG